MLWQGFSGPIRVVARESDVFTLHSGLLSVPKFVCFDYKKALWKSTTYATQEQLRGAIKVRDASLVGGKRAQDAIRELADLLMKEGPEISYHDLKEER